MCGRYALAYDSDELFQELGYYGLSANPGNNSDGSQHYEKSFNVSPTNTAAVYRSDGGTLNYMKWGLVPFWTKDVSQFKTYKTFNARLENLLSSKMWIRCCNHKRCAIPISGYYEWKTIGKQKTPYYITRKNGKLLFLAGMYDYVEAENFYSYTIITAHAPKNLQWLHDRMPVILEPGSDAWNLWMDDTIQSMDQQKLDHVLKAYYDEDTMLCYQVSNDVGKTTNNGERLTKPILMEDKPKVKYNKESNEANVNVSNLKQEQITDIKREEREEIHREQTNISNKGLNNNVTVKEEDKPIGARLGQQYSKKSNLPKRKLKDEEESEAPSIKRGKGVDDLLKSSIKSNKKKK